MAEILIGNIKGPQGIEGQQGERGLQGVQGQQGPLPPIANDLLTTISGSALDARQGKVLNEKLSNMKTTMSATIVIGTSTNGHTDKDVDYLCTGTQDQITINTAINSLINGGKITILDGTYNIENKIVVDKDNITLSGLGTSTILKRQYNETDREGMLAISANFCAVGDMCFNGNKGLFSNTYNNAVYLKSCNNTFLNKLYCFDNSGSGIIVVGGSSNTVNSNKCNDNTQYGIATEGSSPNNSITSNTCNGNNRGIRLFSNRNTVSANTCFNNTGGVECWYAAENSITGNVCSGLTTGIILNYSQRNLVTGNNCYDTDRALSISGNSSNNNVTGNTAMRGTGLSADYTGIQSTITIDAGCVYNLITMNSIMGKNLVNSGGATNTLVNNKYN